MGQQFYVIRNSPQPGTPAFEAKQLREASRGDKNSGTTTTLEVTEAEDPVTPRVQPKKTSRNQRKRK
jgi:YidC/Oxa1 family membrane protein insertase